jgi:excinuclease ABC subunit C
MEGLDQRCTVEPGEAFFARLPDQPAVFLVELETPGAQPYLGRTASLQRALRQLLDPAAPATSRSRPRLAGLARSVAYRLTGSRFEQDLLVYRLARRLFPADYRRRLRLRGPLLLKLDLARPYPRLRLARQVRADGACYLGPFPTRAAAAEAASALAGLFRIRRCHLRIEPDPSFPGCIYGEMKQCLAPCQAAVSQAEYAAAVASLAAFCHTRGASLAAPLEQERAQAAGAEDFERAAAVQKKLDRVAAVVHRLPEPVRTLERFEAVVLQPSAHPAAVEVFRIAHGAISGPATLDFGGLASAPRSAETLLREWLEAPDPPTTPEEQTDHLALLARWLYARPRTGELLFREGAPGGGWPYRRIVRACARLLGPAAERPFAAGGKRSESA